MTNLREKVQTYLENDDMVGLKAALNEAEALEVLYVMADLERDEKAIVYRLLSKNHALAVFEQLESSLQQELLESFGDDKTISIINRMSPDDRVRLLDEVPAKVAKRLIAFLSPEERIATNTLMGYEPYTAGRVMTTKFISLRRDMTVAEALSKVRAVAREKETVFILYVTNSDRKLEGVLTLKTLVISEPEQKVEDIMTTTVISVSTGTEQEEVAHKLRQFDLLAIPVVDKDEHLVGIVTIDDAVDILQDEATDEIYDRAGLADITGKDTNRSEVLVDGSIWHIWKVRLPFLFLTLVAGLLTGSIIGGFEDVLESITAVAIFIPMVMDMGGNVGTQSSTVFVRGLALGHIKMKKFWKHLLKETIIGITMGLVLGLAGGAIAYVWQGTAEGMWQIGLAVGLALMVSVTLASFLGFLVPFVLMKLNFDQVAGSGPIITSIKDVVGLLSYFIFVSIFLGHLL